MILTLYKNTQTESENNNNFTDVWQFDPYTSLSMFDTGFTSEQADFIIPDEYEISDFKGKKVLYKYPSYYELTNTRENKPALKLLGGSCITLILKKKGEENEPPHNSIPISKPRVSSWKESDYFNEDGTLNIW